MDTLVFNQTRQIALQYILSASTIYERLWMFYIKRNPSIYIVSYLHRDWMKVGEFQHGLNFLFLNKRQKHWFPLSAWVNKKIVECKYAIYFVIEQSHNIQINQKYQHQHTYIFAFLFLIFKHLGNGLLIMIGRCENIPVLKKKINLGVWFCHLRIWQFWLVTKCAQRIPKDFEEHSGRWEKILIS